MQEHDPSNASVLKWELQKSIDIKRRVIEEKIPVLEEIAEIVVGALDRGKKLLLFGNGGSAADSQHIAAEFVSRFNLERRALPAIALTTDTSILTAVANDYAFERVFERQLEALGRCGDVALAISTSGNSANVLRAVARAHEIGMTTVGFTGQNGGALKDRVDVCFRAPSNNTARIQEVHITVAHAICGLAEQALCGVDVCRKAVV